MPQTSIYFLFIYQHLSLFLSILYLIYIQKKNPLSYFSTLHQIRSNKKYIILHSFSYNSYDKKLFNNSKFLKRKKKHSLYSSSILRENRRRNAFEVAWNKNEKEKKISNAICHFLSVIK
jgi:hypothetical protein